MKKILLAGVLLLPLLVQAQLTTRVVRDSLFIPWEMVYGPDQHIWFTQKNGYICRLEPKAGHIDTLYHETNTVIQSEGGMLGLALHPNFSTTPEVFVAYNYSQGGYKERIVKYTYSGTALQNPQIILDNISAANFHNGCRLVIVNDKLFITTGDATTASIAQNINAINGKVLRINLDGSIPNDNPLPGSPIWSWGHRNAQGLFYANGKLYESEHGPNNDDEINIIEKGRNYGWPNVEGFCNTPSEITFCADSNVVEPLKAWTPTIAVSDIVYYDKPMFPGFQQSLIMTTLKDQKLYQLTLNNNLDAITTTAVIPNVSFGRLRTVCLSPDGHIYISTSNSNASGSNRIDKIIELYDPNYVPPPVGIGLPVNDKAVVIYPNPANNTLHIYLKNKTSATPAYKMLNIYGQTLTTGRLTTIDNRISLSEVPVGIYTVQITDGDNVIASEKLVKE